MQSTTKPVKMTNKAFKSTNLSEATFINRNMNKKALKQQRKQDRKNKQVSYSLFV